MRDRVKSEIKILGINFFLVSGAFAAALLVFSVLAGELLDFYPVSYEVLFPFFAAIAAGEWGKTRADGNFELIAAQSRALFPWILLRYLLVFGAVSIAAVLSMAGASVLRQEAPLAELLAIYFSPAFFLSSLSALLGAVSRQEHMGSLVCGIVWLVVLLTRSLLRIPGIEYLYLFIRYAGDQNGIWLWNKCIVAAAGLLLWGVIFKVCKQRAGE